MFTWITSVLPWIVSAVKFVEKALGPKTGEQKLAAVLEMILGAVPVPADDAAKAAITAAATQIVNGVVALMNATGVFKKSS